MTEKTVAVLYDGWPLAYRANSPAAIHLATLLALCPPDVHVIVALPEEARLSMPGEIRVQFVLVGTDEANRLRWEQRVLPKIAHHHGVNLIHQTGGYPALFSNINFIDSPSESESISSEPGKSVNLTNRLREALGYGGKSRLAATIWPEDLPVPELSGRLFQAPPVVHPLFQQETPGQVNRGIPGSGEKRDARDKITVQIPNQFILYHGPSNRSDLNCTLEAWSWCVKSGGEKIYLVIPGLDKEGRETLQSLLAKSGLAESVIDLDLISLEDMVQLYQGCRALFHPARNSAWESPIRLALACGKPVVALETVLSDALVGPAGYLARLTGGGEKNSRTLGAALLTVIVEEELSETLSQSARQRASAWASSQQAERFRETLKKVYQSFTL